MWTSWSPAKENVKSYILHGRILHSEYRRGARWRESNFAEKTGGSWHMTWTRASSVPLKQKKANCILGWISKNVARSLKEVILLLYSVLVRLDFKCCASFCVPQYKEDAGILERDPAKGLNDSELDGAYSIWGEDQNWLCSSWRKEAKERPYGHLQVQSERM